MFFLCVSIVFGDAFNNAAIFLYFQLFGSFLYSLFKRMISNAAIKNYLLPYYHKT